MGRDGDASIVRLPANCYMGLIDRRVRAGLLWRLLGNFRVRA